MEMKRILTFCVLTFIGILTMNAQAFVFVDDNDNVIDNGSTLTMDEVELKKTGVEIGEDGKPVIGDDGKPVYTYAPYIPLKGVNIKNISDFGSNCKIVFFAETVPGNSKLSACCAMNCSSIVPGVNNEKSAYAEPGKRIYISGVDDEGNIQETEWLPNDFKGTCTMKITIQGEKSLFPDSEITINFVYNGASGIDAINKNVDNKVVARYSINGQLLDAPQKGINILKYADGRIEKVIVK
jgi:hypothetical protein